LLFKPYEKGLLADKESDQFKNKFQTIFTDRSVERISLKTLENRGHSPIVRQDSRFTKHLNVKASIINNSNKILEKLRTKLKTIHTNRNETSELPTIDSSRPAINAKKTKYKIAVSKTYRPNVPEYLNTIDNREPINM